MKDSKYCPVCGKGIKDYQFLAVFYDPEPQERVRSCIVDSIAQSKDQVNYHINVCDDMDCLLTLLENLKDPEYYKDHFLPTDMFAGTWFHPTGCSHYLMSVHGNHIEDSYLYNNGFWEDEDITPEVTKELEEIKSLADKTEARYPMVSIVGGFGNILDACHHYCSPECAIRILNKGHNIIEKNL